MNRSDLQKLARIRLAESRALFNASQFSGAYYLAGYAVECGLKACIAKSTQRHDFPDKGRVMKSYSHKLNDLLVIANLEAAFVLATRNDLELSASWRLVVNWSEESRYSIWNRSEAEEIIRAVARPRGGVLPWIRQYW